MSRPRPGFSAHLRKYGIDRAAHRRVKTALRALEAISHPLGALLARDAATAGTHLHVCAALREILADFRGEGTTPVDPRPRRIMDVMERIRPLLVAGGVNMTDFEKLRYRLGFASPETHPAYWAPLCEWLAKTLPNPALLSSPAWVREVSAIIEGRQ